MRVQHKLVCLRVHLHFVHSYPVDFLPTTTSAPLLLPRAHVRASTSISPLTSELSSIYLSHQGSPRPQRSSSSDLRPCLACASLVSKNYRTRRHINMDSEDEIPFQILREITDGFSKERKLGQGAFGVVYKGVTKNGDDVAVKRLLINSSLDFKHQLKNELYNLRKLNHPNIVHVLGYCFETEQKPFIMEDGSKVFVDETQGALCLEYMHNGSLQRLLSDEFSGLEWHTRFKIIKGTCEGLKYIHELEEPIYHLDLKPDNILLDKDMVPKIADFGLSRIIHNKEPTRITQNPYGTQGYQPREYIDSGEISGKFDIFSLGVIMIRVVSGPKGYPKCLDMCLDEFVDQVQRNWRNRLQATYSSGSLVEAYCHQVKTCIQLAWLCVEEDSKKRPNIGKITEKLNEIETAIGELCEKYIARLLGLSFFQHSASPTGDREDDVAATVFTMHDLVHDLARSIMLFEIIDASKQCNTGGSRFQFALLNDCTKPLKSFTQYPTAVRALRFHGSDQNVLHGASFLSAKYLCVLDLNECSVQKLPKSIGNLKHLRYINAPRVEHRAIPNCITKLKKLIYLSLRGSYQILALPESIGELKGLMYLDLSGCSRLEKLPVSFGMLTKLVHLDMSGCSDVTGVSESLESLTNLEYLNLSHYRTLSTTKRQPPEALRRLTDLKYLNLSGSTFFIEDHGIIQALCSLTKLQCLNLSKCSLLVRDSHLTWISEAMRNLTELRYLDLSSCSTVSGADEALPIFLECISNLPNLEHLDLSNNRELTRVPDCICSLRKLHRLDLSYCYSLRSLPATLHEMDSLKFLHLHKLLKVPALNKNLITLPHFLVQADYHNSSSNLALLQDVNRTDLVISRLENVKSVQEARSVRLMEKGIKKMKLNWTRDSERFVEDMELLAELIPPITLEKLFIDGYSSVRFPEWFIGIADHLPNLCRISLSNLPKCNALPPLGQLPNLEELNFCGMSGISKIDGDLYGTRRPSFPRLKDFSLSGMESLEVWYTTYSHGGDGVSKFMFPNLQRLTICECPNLRQKPCPHRAEERWNIWGACDGVISSWEERASQTAASSPSSAPVTTLLCIDSCKVPMHKWRLLHHLPALTKLEIYGCSNLSSSPEIMQALSSLQSLTLWSRGQPEPELPNWLGQLASLKKLTIEGYEVQALQGSMGHLSLLQSLCLKGIESMTALP
ncbi:hypothetical protein PAHAL_8G119700 [Panicum hallii]|uniref:Protein kinase domain-containing protein n=1 Tax=Panicum hallii TaxID=206008 RepID=A0A2T8I8M7_9POAL|nr:hypothetical protein PAHAL_8G119700 [Panicum hallii]